MALKDVPFVPVNPEDAVGTIWAQVGGLAGEGPRRNPFNLDTPTQAENPQLAALEERRLSWNGSGRVTQFNIDLPTGVTLELRLDGVVKVYSHGNESGIRRWLWEESPLQFSTSLEVVVKNTTGTGQRYLVHLSGA